MSATLVEIGQYGACLFDCGEGTYGQLYRRFGYSRLGSLISIDLKAVFISHLHADHHLGLVRILTERAKWQAAKGAPRTSLLVVGPSLLGIWLEEYASSEDLGAHQFVDCENFSPPTALHGGDGGEHVAK